jgi:hypothetical protein
MLVPPPDAVARLAALREERKYEAESDGFLPYTGVRDPSERAKAEETVNGVITAVAEIVTSARSSEAILAVFRAGLDQVTLSDTEDRERTCAYFEQIMDCIGLESSEGLLNDWLYGFDPA